MKDSPSKPFLDACYELDAWWHKWIDEISGQEMVGIMETKKFMQMAEAKRR